MKFKRIMQEHLRILCAILLTQCFFFIFIVNFSYGAIVFPADSYYAEVNGRTTAIAWGSNVADQRPPAPIQEPHYATWSGEVSGIFSPWEGVNESYVALLEARASLPTGSIKVRAQANDDNGYVSTEAGGYGLIQETLYLDWHSSVIDPIPVTVNWMASGFASASTYLAAETSVSIAMGGPDKISQGITETRDLTGGFAYISETVIFNPSIDDHFLTVRAYLTTTVKDGVSDFSHTGTFSIDLPEGVTTTSASGVFLTEAVPIPGAIWLLGSGLIGIIGFRKKFKK